MGLQPDHVYAILKAKTVEVDGESHNLLNMFNPWGHFEWKGDWSDDSARWTDKLRKELQFENKDDGSFWIDYDDFKDYFPTCNIIKYRDNYVLNAVTHTGKTGVHLFKVETPGRYCFSI